MPTISITYVRKMQCHMLSVLQYVKHLSLSGMRLYANQLNMLCVQLSTLKCLTSLQLGNNVVDLTPRTALDAVCSLMSALPALRHLDLSDVCLTGCVREVLNSIISTQLERLELSEQWLGQQDVAALQQFQQQNAIIVTLN